ncbi:MAG: DNA-binding protein WhiA [Oscillospiraceae bacterium]|nr:DNA-binding protein WhiA [Oscillospiraceae bacterium]
MCYNNFKKKEKNSMSFSNLVKEELEKAQLLDKNKRKTPEFSEKAYVRDAFFKHGFVNDPRKKYHLEVSFKTKEEAIKLQNLLVEKGIVSKSIPRLKNYIVYIKDGEEISKFLAYIGVVKSVLNFEEERVVKEAKNNINRIVNCEAANTDRIIGASIRHIEAINYLIENDKFEGLPDNLKEVAILRKNDPSLSMTQLGELLEKPISKTSVNYRLQKVLEFAKKARV